MNDTPSTRTVEDLRAERLAALNLMEDAIASREALAQEKLYAEKIVETLHEPLLVLHPDLTVRSVNPAFYTHFQVNPPETIGRKIYDLGNGQWNIPALRTLLEDVLPDSNVFNDYEVTHNFETLGRRVMLVNGRRLDHVQFILLGIRDITERKRTEERQTFLLKLSDDLRARFDEQSIKERTVQMLGEHLQADRCYISEVFEQQGYSTVGPEHLRPGVPQMSGTFRLADYPATMRELTTRPLVVHDAEGDPRFSNAEKVMLAQVRQRALLVAPLWRGQQGGVWAVPPPVPTPRQWTDSERLLLEEVAERTWTAVERARAEQALRVSEEKYRTLFETIDEGYLIGEVIFDDNNRAIDILFHQANPAALRIAGRNFIGQRMREIDPRYEEYWFEVYGRVARTGESVRAEHYAEPHGRWFEFHLSKVGGLESRLVASVFQDVTERKRAEQALGNSEERYRSIVNQNVAGILQVDVKGNVLFANQQFCLAVDRSLDELRKLTVRDLVHPDDFPESVRLLKKMARNGKPFEMEKRLLRADGTPFWVHNAITPITSPDGKIHLATIVSLDINSRREAEAQLRANEEQFRRAIEDAPIPVIMHAEDGQVLQISRTWTELTGYQQEDIPNFEAWLNKAYGLGANRVREHMHKLFRGRVRKLDVEIDVITRHGERRRWSFSASAPGTLRDGRRYIVGMAVDVTERAEELKEANLELRALSRRLVEAQETERRKVSETLHDDFGQVLTGLNLVLKRARKTNAGPELEKAEALVADLLERVRNLSMNLRPHVLDNLGLVVALRWHLQKFSEQSGIATSLRTERIPRQLPPELATTVFRIVQEALTNVARHSAAKRASVKLARRAGAIEVAITDNGRGFDPGKLGKSTAGLANMRERVRLTGGEFFVEAKPRKGTTIRATLPLSAP
jgi:PAS domain S-box-containing protein